MGLVGQLNDPVAIFKVDHVPKTSIAFSEAVEGGGIGECLDYELSLVLPPDSQTESGRDGD